MINWGELAAWGGIVFGLVTSVGYLIAHDYRRALYFFLGAAIGATITWR
jgi:hypothetical protein